MNENDIGVWEPNELVYSASDIPTYSYLVIEGQAQIVSPRAAVEFHRIQQLLEKHLLFSAKSYGYCNSWRGWVNCSSYKIGPFNSEIKQDIFLSALVRKLEARLSNSNEKAKC